MIKDAIQSLVDGRSLTIEESARVMEEIMDGQVTAAQFGAFVTALRIKGETAEEIAGLAGIMRARAVHVDAGGPVVDTCGTGGDNAATFNISTAAAFVVAGTGIRVAKHGNRAISSRAGSADVLEALGIKIDLTPGQVETCLRQAGIGFMFAPAFHPSMKYAAAPRREIGIRTVFNILGPLTNPAGAQSQVVGIPSEALGERMARALGMLGTKHAILVHGRDGIDEISIAGQSRIWEVSRDTVVDYYISPGDFGFERAAASAMKGGSPAENAAILKSVLTGERGARRDVTVMNAAAAIMVGRDSDAGGGMGGVSAIVACAKMAQESIDSGRAMERLEALVRMTQNFAAG